MFYLSSSSYYSILFIDSFLGSSIALSLSFILHFIVINVVSLLNHILYFICFFPIWLRLLIDFVPLHLKYSFFFPVPLLIVKVASMLINLVCKLLAVSNSLVCLPFYYTITVSSVWRFCFFSYRVTTFFSCSSRFQCIVLPTCSSLSISSVL